MTDILKGKPVADMIKADMSKKERPWTCVHDLFYFIFINETTIYCVCCKIALTYLVGDDMMMA